MKTVIKIGTSTLTYQNGCVNIRRIESLCKIVADLMNAGNQVILVSSGAIGMGVGKLNLKERPKDIAGKQAAAAVGQCELMAVYDRLFGEYGQTTAQVLLTRDVIVDSHRKENVTNTFNALLDLGVIPIVNENDTVSVEEIEFGDNDKLSAIVAAIIGADALIILTDIDGLYDSDPSANPDAKLIPEVNEITDELLAIAGGSGTNRGTGGMHSKLEAASLALEHGITTVITSSENLDNLYDVFEDKPIGTTFRKKD